MNKVIKILVADSPISIQCETVCVYRGKT